MAQNVLITPASTKVAFTDAGDVTTVLRASSGRFEFKNSGESAFVDLYANDIVLDGNLTVGGTTTTVNTSNILIEDPILQLAKGQTTGTPTVDIGFLGLRGGSNNAAFIWDESDDVFAAILTTDDASGTTLTPASYAGFKAGVAALSGTTNDGAAAVLTATQAGTGRAVYVTRSVASATRAMADFAQLSASGGASPAVHIQQTTTASDALRITSDGSTAKFAVTGTGALTGTSAAFSGWATLGSGGDFGRLALENNNTTAGTTYLQQSYSGTAELRIGSSVGNHSTASLIVKSGTAAEVKAQGNLTVGGALTGAGAGIFSGNVEIKDGSLLKAYRAGNSAYAGLFMDTGEKLYIRNSWGNKDIVMLRTGEVGIGTSAPYGGLHVNASNYGESPTINKALLVSDSADVTKYLILTYHASVDVGIIQGLDDSLAWKNVAINPNGGKVGIGTTAPSTKLHAILDSSATNTPTDILRLGHTSSGSTAVGFGALIRFDAERTGTTTDGMGRLGFVADAMTSSRVDGAFIVQTGLDGSYTERFRIKSDGNVGIGTNAPTARLNVKASGSTVDQIAVTHSGNTVEIAQLGQSANGNSAGALLLKSNNGQTKIYLDAAGSSYLNGGSVGIGTAAPAANLHIYEATTDTPLQITRAANTGNAMIKFETGATDDWIVGLRNDSTSDFRFYSYGTSSDALTIKRADGNVGIGTTSPSKNLHIKSTASGNTGIIIENTNNAQNLDIDYWNNAGAVQGRIRYAEGAGDLYIYPNASASIAFAVKWDGKVGIGTTAPDNPLEVVGADSGIKISSASSNRPHLRFECGTAEKMRLSANSAYGAIGDSSDANRYMAFKDGNVGIGTTAPTAKLFVMGGSTARAFQAVSSSAGNATGYFYTNMVHTGVDTSATVSIRSDHASSSGQILHVRGDGSGNLLTLDQGGTNRLVVQADGKVGIGTTAPAGFLSVEGAGNSRGIFVTANGATTYSAIQAEAGALTTGSVARFYSNSATTNTRYLVNVINDNAAATGAVGLRIQQDSTAPALVALGNVGIGTAAPLCKLDIRTTSASLIDAGATVNIEEDAAWTQGLALYINNADTYNGDYASACIGVANSGSNIIITAGAKVVNDPASSNGYKTLNSTAPSVYRQLNGAHLFYGDTGKTANTLYTPTERMRIAVDGKVGIGITAPTTTLDVYHATHSQLTVSSPGNQDSSLSLIERTSVSPFGSANVYGFQWKYDGGDNKLYLSSGVDTNVVNRLTVQRDDGNVGIGTTSPTQKLHITGSMRLTGALYDKDNSVGSAGQILATNGSGTYWSSAGAGTVTGTGTANYISKWTGTNSQGNSIIQDNGTSVGIGVNPNAANKLEVYGQLRATTAMFGNASVSNVAGAPVHIKHGGTAIIRLEDSTSTNYVYDLTADFTNGFRITDVTSSIDPFTIAKTSGYVGIGTTVPSALLHIQDTLPVIRLQSNNSQSRIDFTDGSTIQATIGLNPTHGDSFSIAVGGSGSLTSDVRLLVKPDGKVGIGTTVPTAKLHVAGDGLFDSLRTTYHFSKSFAASFANGTANLVGYISFGNSNPWGWIEVTLTGSYSNTNITGRYTKRFAIGRNVSAGISSQSSEVIANIGDIAGKFKIGAFEVSGTTLRLPIYSLTSLGNNVQIFVEGHVHAGSAAALIVSSLSCTTPVAVSNTETRDYFTMMADRVGIGTNAPAATLDVHGSMVRISSDGGTYRRLMFFDSLATPNKNNFQVAVQEINNALHIGPSTAVGGTTFSGSTGLAMLANGNVGIGTTAPGAKLDVNGSAIVRGVLHFDSTASSFIDNVSSKIKIGGDAGVGLWTYVSGWQERLTVLDDGKVGIGTTAPSAKLEVLSDGSIAQGAEIRLQHGNNNSTDVVSTVNFANNAGSVAMIQAGTTGANNSGYISFFTDNAGTSDEHMRIISDGKVGIGTNAPDTLLDLQAAAGADILLRRAVGDTSSNLGVISFGNADVDKYLAQIKAVQDGATDSARLEFQTEVTGGAKATRMTIKSDGKVGFGTTSPAADVHFYQGPDNRVMIESNGPTLVFKEINSTNQNWAFYHNAGALNIRTLADNFGSTVDRVTFLQDGKVGIGTDSPATPLHVRKVGNPASGGNRSTVEEVLTLDATGYYPYTGYGVGVSFKGEDYGNTAIREYAKIQSVMTGYLSQTPAGDPSFKSALTFWTNTGGASGTLATEKVRIDNQGNVGIGTAAPSAKIHVAGTGDVARIGDNHWRGTNSVTVGTTYATGVTVNLANHKSGYLKVIISGDWSGHSAIGYMSEYFIQKGSTVRYSQPGTVIREVTNQHNTDFITSQILDPTLNDGNADFAIQFKTNTGSVSCTVMYEFTGTANSVT
jgi:hypothetical protein